MIISVLILVLKWRGFRKAAATLGERVPPLCFAGTFWRAKLGVSTPSAGSSVNLTPRIGVGASFEVAPNARILTGFRWAHISNANVADNNDGRNSVQLYAGLSLPF